IVWSAPPAVNRPAFDQRMLRTQLWQIFTGRSREKNFPLIGLQEKYSAVNKNGRLGNAGLEQLGELLGNYRTAEIVPLGLVTMVSPKKFQLFLRFHTLCNDPQLQAPAHANDCGHDGR